MATCSQLDQLVSYFASGNKAEFARMLGISRQHLNIWYSREYLDIKKVFFACPGVSAEWLLTGEGNMLEKDRQRYDGLDSALFIPFINTDDIITGKWYNPYHYVLLKGDEFFYSFFTRMPGCDLSRYIYHGSILGCQIIEPNEFKKECLYIVRTENRGTFFVEYLGEETIDGHSVHKFTTRRDNEIPEIQLALPSEDIAQCAEIADYSVNHYIENVI